MSIKNTGLLGYIIPKPDLCALSLVDLKRELINHLFEITIVKLGVQAFLDHELESLDASVGDWKCQTRAMILLDLSKKYKNLVHGLKLSIHDIENVMNRMNQLLERFDCFNSVECQNFIRENLQHVSLSELYCKYELNYICSYEVRFLGLMFLTNLENQKLPIFQQHVMSINKLKEIINKAKKELCHISIAYEQSVAVNYGSLEIVKMLNQVEHKNVQSMTALYLGFVSIFNKIIHDQDYLMVNKIIFCTCGGILKIDNNVYTSDGVQLKKIENLENILLQEAMIIEAYQYPGSLIELQNILDVPSYEVDIPYNYFKECVCAQPWSPCDTGYSLYDKIMGFFAQHPQFTNGAHINWDISDANVLKIKDRYDQLLNLIGVSRHDMSIFQINHMYASIVANVLQKSDNFFKD